MKSATFRLLLSSCLFAFALQFSLARGADAVAESTQPPPPNASSSSTDPQPTLTLNEVIVTATRVVRKDFTAPTPTIVMSSDDIQATGAANVGDIAAQVPAFIATSTPTTSTLSEDTGRGNFLDLRGLGPSRTLILVDGERFVPTTIDGLVDTDVIPEAIISHVDTVTGGGSADWGSNAVAGVVNIVLNHDLTGLQGDLRGGVSQYGDNRSHKVSLAYGSDFAAGRGHFEIAGEATANSGILRQSDRPWAARDWGIVQTPQYSLDTVPDIRFSIATYGGLILNGPDAGMQFGPGGTLQPFQYGSKVGSLLMEGGGGATFAPTVALELPQDRQNVFSRISYHISPSVNVFIDALFSQANTEDPNLVANFDLVDTIPTTNAFLPASVAAAYNAAGQTSFLLGRDDRDDFGFISSTVDDRVWRVVGGVDGSVGQTWTWNAYYEFGRVTNDEVVSNVINEVNYANALDSVIDPGTGSPVCRSTLTSPNNGCVPIDIFGVGSPSGAALKYVLGSEPQHNIYTQDAAAFSVQGEPFSIWAGPVSIATGVDFRRDAVQATVSALEAAGDFLVGDAQGFRGSERVTEGFAETVVPLLSGRPFAKSLDADLAVRFTDYNISGSVTTWKAGLTDAINDQVRLRAVRSRDIRAPNLFELFGTGGLNFETVTDPVTGQSDFITNPSPPNSALKPEEANTTTVGVIYQPDWAPDLSMSGDYYEISMSQVISTLSAQSEVTLCGQGDSSLCSLVQRTAGVITQVSTPNINVDQFYTNGADFEVADHFPLSKLRSSWRGSLSLRLLGTYVANLTTKETGTTVDEAGAVGAFMYPNSIGGGNLAGVPHWRMNFSAAYKIGPGTAYLEERYIGAGKLDNLYGPGVVPDNHVAAVFYTDATLQYELPGFEHGSAVLYGNVHNLWNRSPPIIVDPFIAPHATNPTLYDVIGRTFQLGVRFRF